MSSSIESTQANSPPSQRFKYVEFDIPFVLFLADSIRDTELEAWARAYRAGEPLPDARYAPRAPANRILIGAAVPVFVPGDSLAKHYIVQLPDTTVAVRTLRRVNPTQATVVIGEASGDRAGRASFTSVSVAFDLRAIPSQHHDDLVGFAGRAVDAINRTIEHYRVIADRPHVYRLDMNTVQAFVIRTQWEDDTSTAQQYGCGMPIRGFGGSLEAALDDELRDAVAASGSPDIQRTLDANIRDYLSRGEERLAVIECAVLFEAWVSGFVRAKFAAMGLDQAAIDAKFKKSDGSPLSATAITKNLVRESTGFDFAVTGEFSRWATDVRDVRNQLVHGQTFAINRGKSALAYSAYRDAIALLSTK